MPSPQPLGFLAAPPSGPGRGVLVLHAWWGLNDTVRAFCTQLAGVGFTAFAPDLYHAKIAATIPEAEALRDAMDGKQAFAEIMTAVDYFNASAAPSPQGLAVIGFSLGAYFALQLSIIDPARIRQVVVYYGTGPREYTAAQASYLGHFAASDPYESPEEVEAFQKALQAAHRPATFYHYPGTGHWFAEPDRLDAYDPAATALAWERTLAFLKKSPLL